MAGETQKLLGHLLRLADQATSDAALVGRWANRRTRTLFPHWSLATGRWFWASVSAYWATGNSPRTRFKRLS